MSQPKLQGHRNGKAVELESVECSDPEHSTPIKCPDCEASKDKLLNSCQGEEEYFDKKVTGTERAAVITLLFLFLFPLALKLIAPSPKTLTNVFAEDDRDKKAATGSPTPTSSPGKVLKAEFKKVDLISEQMEIVLALRMQLLEILGDNPIDEELPTRLNQLAYPEFKDSFEINWDEINNAVNSIESALEEQNLQTETIAPWTTIKMFGVFLFGLTMLYLMQNIVRIYRFSTKMTAFYFGRRILFQLMDDSLYFDNNHLSDQGQLFEILLAERIEIGHAPAHPTKKALKILESVGNVFGKRAR